MTGPAAAAKVLPVAAPPPALKALRPAAGGSAGPSSSAAPPPSTSASAAGTSGPGKGSFTSHKPSAAVLSGRVINANAQPPPFIAVASRNVDAPGVGTAKTVSAAQAAAAAALAGRPVTPGDTAGASSAKGGRPVAPADTVGAPGAKAGRPVTPAETLGASSLKPGLDPTPKQAAAVLAARTSKVGRQVVVASEGPTAGSAAPSVIKTLGTGPIRQGSFVAVAKAAAGVSLGAGSKLVLEGALSASGPSPLAGESFPTLQAVISQSNSRPSSADTGPGKQPRAHLEKGGLQSDESAGGSAAGGLGAWGKSLVKTSSGLAAESIAAESRGPEKVGQVGTGAKTANGGSDNKQNAEAGLPTSTSRASETTAPAETAPAPGTLKDVLSKSPANRAGSLRIARTEAERASLESTSGFHFERSAEIPVSRRSSHGDEGLLRAVTGFGSGTGVFVPGFLNQDTLSRSSSPQPAGTGVFLPGLSRTSSGGGGSPSWGGIGRGMLQERGGGMLDQGGSPKFNRLLGMNMEGGSPRMFRQGSPFEGGSPKFFHQGGGVGSPNYGRLGPGYLEGGSPKFGRVGPFQGEGGSPAYGRANGGQMMGMLEMANFGRPPGGHFNSLVEGGSPSFARPAMSAPVSRLARLGGPAGDAETAAEGSRKMEQNALGGAKESGAGLKEPGFEQLRRLRTGNPRQEEPAKKEPGSPGESSVIADILGMEFDPWADGPLPDPSGLAKILLAEERAKAAAAAAKTSTPGAPPARQSRFKFAWESDGPTEEPASEGGVRKSRFDFAGSSDTVPTPADSAMVSSSAGVKSRFGFTLEKDKGGVDTARPGTAGSSGAGSDAGGRFSPAPGLTTSESSETSSRPQSGSRPSTAEDDGNVNGARFGGGIVRPGSASGKPLLPAPPGFVNRGRGGAPAGSQGAYSALVTFCRSVPAALADSPRL